VISIVMNKLSKYITLNSHAYSCPPLHVYELTHNIVLQECVLHIHFVPCKRLVYK